MYRSLLYVTEKTASEYLLVSANYLKIPKIGKKRTTFSKAGLKRIMCVSVVYLFVAKSTTSFSISDHVSWFSNNTLPCLHYLACFLSFYRTYMHAVIVCLLTTSLESCLTTSMSRTAFSHFYYFKFDQLRSD